MSRARAGDKEEVGRDVATGSEQERPLSLKRLSVMICNLALTDLEMGFLFPKMASSARPAGKQMPRPKSKNGSGCCLASDNQLLMRDESTPLYSMQTEAPTKRVSMRCALVFDTTELKVAV